MDSDATLAEIRNLVDGLAAPAHYSSPDMNLGRAMGAVIAARRLAELIRGLDQSLSEGGSLPTDWQRHVVREPA